MIPTVCTVLGTFRMSSQYDQPVSIIFSFIDKETEAESSSVRITRLISDWTGVSLCVGFFPKPYVLLCITPS